mmetsp:Transcript_20649/g.66610  ORF Transcript_20649/g.66610 Transcript_20649/m.66610 type:complete len:241 (-) Transcript_20649:558-1280(-)
MSSDSGDSLRVFTSIVLPSCKITERSIGGPGKPAIASKLLHLAGLLPGLFSDCCSVRLAAASSGVGGVRGLFIRSSHAASCSASRIFARRCHSGSLSRTLQRVMLFESPAPSSRSSYERRAPKPSRSTASAARLLRSDASSSSSTSCRMEGWHSHVPSEQSSGYVLKYRLFSVPRPSPAPGTPRRSPCRSRTRTRPSPTSRPARPRARPPSKNRCRMRAPSPRRAPSAGGGGSRPRGCAS